MKNLFIGLASALAMTTGVITPILKTSSIIEKLDTDVDVDLANKLNAQMIALITKTVSSYTEYTEQFDLKRENVAEAWKKIKIPYDPQQLPSEEDLNAGATLMMDKLNYMLNVGSTIHKYISESISFYLPKNIKETAPQILEANNQIKSIISSVNTRPNVKDKCSLFFADSLTIEDAQTRISTNFSRIIAKSQNLIKWLKNEVDHPNPEL